MKVSILMTTYNTEKYIGEAIKSFIEQDLPFEWELLVGDDGSTDDTVKIVNKWVEQYPNNIKVFVHERGDFKSKTGSRAAKNRAFLLERAKGEYIHFLDGDDCFLGKDTIKKQVEILDNPQFSDCSCCAQNMLRYKIITGNKIMSIPEGIGDRIYDITQYWSKYYFSTDTILFRHKCIELLLHPLYRDFLNDNGITFLLLQYGKIYYQDIVGAQYNETGDGLWTGNSKVYGAFRGLQLYDVELKVRPNIEKLSFKKHNSDIRRIRKDYNKTIVNEITPLMEGLDPNVFKITYLFYKLESLTFKEHLYKLFLYCKADFVHFTSLWGGRFKKYVLRKSFY